MITGFLGSGKTTAILHLLANKPEHETWGVLVNEFGEIGIDGAMMAGKGAVVREVPGGCMCCVAGLPMQIGLNMLIARSKPDRILIEPTGLGHPEQILNTLTGEYYDEVLDLRASICLMDPRHLNDSRYLENDNFRDQAQLSDVLVANKTDLCSDEHRHLFEDYSRQFVQQKTTGWAQHGALKMEWLDLPRYKRDAHNKHAHSHHQSMPDTAPLVLPEGETYIRKENNGQGYHSCGWLYDEKIVFSYEQMFLLFSGIPADRLKAVIRTDLGLKGFNGQNGVVSVLALDQLDGSRIEIIDKDILPWVELEASLFKAILKDAALSH
nr:GTP-binding protein [Kistimonas asteriae]